MEKFKKTAIVMITLIAIAAIIVIIARLFGASFFESGIMAFAILCLILLIAFDSLATSRDRSKGREKFYKLLTTKFKKNLVSNKEDIVILLNSIGREYSSDYSVAPILEDYLAYTTDKDDELSNENYNFLKDIIKDETVEKPFSNIPEEERRLLRNINNSVKNNDFESIKNDLQELNSVISTKNRIYQRTNKINRWSLPCAVAGIILTIIFGTMSLRKIDYKIPEEFYKKMIKESIEEYKKEPNENS
ncbi:MAG: hypothetical protein LBC85_11065 [Fibromonadaceae bacterium]|jgi:hypothetical protein|nr:hypothetical protein [Fibromonadaceae bacterium]